MRSVGGSSQSRPLAHAHETRFVGHTPWACSPTHVHHQPAEHSPFFRPSHSMIPLLHPFLIALLAVPFPVSAYIPAEPTNDTNLAIQDGLNVSDISRVIVQWYSPVASG